MDLNITRSKIDEIDEKLVSLFEQRMELTKEVAEYKIATGKPVYDKEREEEKIKVLTGMTEDEFNKRGIKDLFTEIMSISRKYQYQKVESAFSLPAFQQMETIDLEGKTVVCFGEHGSYAEQAMEEYFGQVPNSFNELTFRGVMDAVEKGEADYGVLPIENSSTGSITDVYDLLNDYDICIIGEHVLKVDQALLGTEEAQISDLRRVYSHPQGLLQCQRFLEENPKIKGITYDSTSASARKVFEENDVTQGAIASRRAAQLYGLKVIKCPINDNQMNATRFIIIAKKKIYLSHANKVIVCFEVPHESGTLHSMLSHVIFSGLNMTKIASRPLADRPWEYRFILEFEGNLNQEVVQYAIRGMAAESTRFKMMGNFYTR